jgi:hypothetical protein
MLKNMWRRPIRAGEIVAVAWSMFRRNPNDLLIMGTVAAIPAFVSNLLLTPIIERLPAFTGQTELDLTQDDWLLLAGAGTPLTVLGFLFLAAIYRAVYDLCESGSFSMPSCYLTAASRAPALLLAGFICVVAPTLLAATLVGIPVSVFFMVSWALAPLAIMVEDLGGLAGLARSQRLVRRSWWHTLAALLMLVLVVLLLPSMIVFGIFGFLFQNLLSQALMGIVLNAFTTPIFAAGEIALYFDLRARKGEFIGPSNLRTAEPVSPGEGA